MNDCSHANYWPSIHIYSIFIQGFGPDEIEKIMGGNVVRLLRHAWQLNLMIADIACQDFNMTRLQKE